MSESKLTVTSSQSSVLFNPEYTGLGVDMKKSAYPPVVNVLQSDKQFTAFPGSKASELVDHYGKLFVRTDENVPTDLVESITGAIIKIEQGHEVRSSDNNILSSDSRFLSKEEKASYVEQGAKPINMVKILIALGDSTYVTEKMAVYKEKAEKGTVDRSDLPFAVVTVKGNSWGSWLNALESMGDLSQEKLGKRLEDVLISVFKLRVSSEKVSGTFGDYYSLVLEPEFNTLEEAVALAPYLLEMKEIGLFYKVSERIVQAEEDVIEATFSDLE
jgi:hypothetical protein